MNSDGLLSELVCIEKVQMYVFDTPEMQQASQVGSKNASWLAQCIGPGQQPLAALWGGMGRQSCYLFNVLVLKRCLFLQPTPVFASHLFRPSRAFQTLLFHTEHLLQLSLMQRPCQNRQAQNL